MGLLISLAALVIAVVAAATALRELQEARKANAFPAVVDLFREYRSEEMIEARRLLFQRLPGLDPVLGFRDLPDEVRDAAHRVSHFLDNLGVLVAQGLLDPKTAAGFLGVGALNLWVELKPFIARERELRDPPAYQEYFEHLAATLRGIDPMASLEQLKKWD